MGDEAEKIAAAVQEALERTGAVITTGGLGPTSDDLTKPAIARLFNRDMRFDASVAADLEQRWRNAYVVRHDLYDGFALSDRSARAKQR